jgi:hypothetical protein
MNCLQVKKLGDCIGEEVEKAVAEAKNGEVCRLSSKYLLNAWG